MPILSNPRHERFARALASGKSATEAYKAAGYKADRKNAARLTTNDGVMTRLAELQHRAAEKAEITVDSLIAECDEARELALSINQPAAAIAAIKEKGVLSGLRIEREERGKPGEFVARMPVKSETAEEWAQQLNGSSPQSSGNLSRDRRPN